MTSSSVVWRSRHTTFPTPWNDSGSPCMSATAAIAAHASRDATGTARDHRGRTAGRSSPRHAAAAHRGTRCETVIDQYHRLAIRGWGNGRPRLHRATLASVELSALSVDDAIKLLPRCRASRRSLSSTMLRCRHWRSAPIVLPRFLEARSFPNDMNTSRGASSAAATSYATGTPPRGQRKGQRRSRAGRVREAVRRGSVRPHAGR